jgi:hypothetical protein
MEKQIMTAIKTEELTGKALDWAIEKALGYLPDEAFDLMDQYDVLLNYSMSPTTQVKTLRAVVGQGFMRDTAPGRTRREAIFRAIAKHELGATVDVPAEVMTQ